MKFDKPENSNYCATITQIKNIIDLPNCDNVVATTLFGFQGIVGKEVKVGDIGVFFPAETQLSENFCHFNNLHRHSELNEDKTKKGYIEDNRRIRAIKFRGNNSSCLFMPLECLASFVDEKEMNELAASIGAEFDTLNGMQVCKKYVVPVKPGRDFTPAPKAFTRVDVKHMPEHIDSDNYHKWGDTIPENKEIIVTQKIHGTSIRVGHTIAKRKLNIFERLSKYLGFVPQETVYDYVYGSRKVIKDVNNPYQNHYYGSDIWTREGEKLKGLLPQNYIVYAELVGWTGELPIQKNYTYMVESGKAQLYVYRIAIINHDGFITDLSWDQLKEFCNQVGLKHVPELWRGTKSEFIVTDWMDKRYADEVFPDGVKKYEESIPLSDKDTVDEGVCIRIDGMRPRILKAKCAKFFEHETKLLDQGDVDLETSGEEVLIDPNKI